MAKKRIKKISTVIAWILLILLLLGGIAFILKHTANGTEDFKTFMLSVTDTETGRETEIVNAKSEMTFLHDRVYRFDTKYLFDGFSDVSRGYSVTIVPNPEEEFEFEADGRPDAWSLQGDLTEYFDIVVGESSFTLSFSQNQSVRAILRKRYAGKQIELSESVKEGSPFFVLCVSSYNEEVNYQIVFSLENVSVQIYPGNIIF